MKKIIEAISIAQEEKWKNETGVSRHYPLAVYTEKAALLINQMLYNIVQCLPSKRWYRYSQSNDPCDKRGGGFLMKADPWIGMNAFGEVFMILERPSAVWSYLKKAQNRAEIQSAVKEKIAYALKAYWRRMTDGTPEEQYVLKLTFDPRDRYSTEVGQVTYNEYRALYEHMHERDPKKSVKNYGAAAVASMIGAPIKDQFVITSIATIEQEIASLCDQMKQDEKSINEEWHKERSILENKYNALLQKSNAEYAAKIEELRQQITAMKSVAAG